MAKSKPISIRISNEAQSDFFRFKKELKLKSDSEALSLCLAFSRALIDWVFFSMNSEYAKNLDKKRKEVQKILATNSPQMGNQISEIIKSSEKEYYKGLDRIKPHILKLLKIYIPNKKPGRPKKIKKRGKPTRTKKKRGRHPEKGWAD